MKESNLRRTSSKRPQNSFLNSIAIIFSFHVLDIFQLNCTLCIRTAAVAAVSVYFIQNVFSAHGFYIFFSSNFMNTSACPCVEIPHCLRYCVTIWICTGRDAQQQQQPQNITNSNTTHQCQYIVCVRNGPTNVYVANQWKSIIFSTPGAVFRFFFCNYFVLVAKRRPLILMIFTRIVG